MKQHYILGWIDEFALKDLSEFLKTLKPKEEAELLFNSGGGDLTAGIGMYGAVKSSTAKLYTRSLGLCGSAATMPYLGVPVERREMMSHEYFLIHPPMSGAEGTADEIQAGADDVREWENRIADIYEKETDMSREDIIAYMKRDVPMSADFAISNGFAGLIKEFKAVASISKKKNENNTIMSFKKDIINGLSALVGNLKGEVTNKVVNTAQEVEIDFTELEDGDEIAVGAYGEIDGKPATGEHVMKDGSTVTFGDDGKVETKVDAEEEEEDETLENRVAAMETRLEEMTNSAKETTEAVKTTNESVEKIATGLEEILASVSGVPKVKKKVVAADPRKVKNQDESVLTAGLKAKNNKK